MLTWQSWMQMMRALEPGKRVTCLLFAGSIFFCFVLAQLTMRTEDPEPITAPWVSVRATLASAPDTWDYDKSLYTFQITYKEPSGQVTRRRIYAQKTRYDAANINKKTPLFVEIEDALSGPIVRRLSTDNEVLYEPSLKQYVIEIYNLALLEGTVFFSLLSLASFGAAGVMHWQNRQRKKLSELS
ncbi:MULTISPECIES: hypothetical protein [Pseudomonas]|uniref:hypothetical protein n=1 Tax=Pseudomonas TaxID=286 RepID=UPI000778E65F|nr:MULTISPECIES: hypothetical protein [Pseudomonas]KYC24721.1 hypothetical protein WM94_09015 [Pseudomonas sp. ABFPK]MBA6111215.1 hypothetical protein [Pseudomonas asiatica]